MSAKHKPQLHEEIFSLMYGCGGFTHSDVYNMPTYLRHFYLKKLIEQKKAEQKQIDSFTKKQKSNISRYSGPAPKIR